MSYEPLLSALVGGIGGGLAGAIAAFALTVRKQIRERARRTQGHRRALKAEIDECHRIAQLYPKKGIASPLYRLPTFFYHQALPGLLADGQLHGGGSNELLLFYSEVETVNRGLNRIDRLLTEGQLETNENIEWIDKQGLRIPANIGKAIDGEFGRIQLKTNRIVSELYETASEAAIGRQ